MTDRIRTRVVIGGGLAVVLVLLAVLGSHPVRMVLALACCLVLPGLGWARRTHTRDLGDAIAMTLTMSICATVVVATAMAVSGWWSTAAGTAVLLGVAALGFTPARVVDRVRDVLEPGSHHVVVSVGETGQDWSDWYSSARRRAETERVEAESRWIEWYSSEGSGQPQR